MRTDRQLQEDVLKALEWDPGVDAAKIGVSVKNGVATLQGFVRSYFEKSTAERVARHVYGVRAIANDIGVTLDGFAPHSDPQIAEAVANAIASDSAVPLNAIKVTATDGWITLRGDVDWQYQKSAAQIDAERRTGVKGVTNLIALKARPHANPITVKARIEDAFKRSAEVDSARIKVQALDGEVILTGTVKSLSERDEAERAAWAAPGVTKVDDRIAVSPF
jgi:osmotically-inducible protein OsmY